MMDTLAVAQRKMKRIMLGITPRDRKRNTWIRQETGVIDIINAIRKAKHRWACQIAWLSEQKSGSQEIEPENRVVQKKIERRSHQTDRTLMTKISQAQTLVGSTQAGVPLSTVNTNPDDDEDDDDRTFAKLAKFVRVRTLKPVDLEEDSPITKFLENKTLNFFCKGTNNNHKFKGCFVRDQVSLNGFQIFNGCIVELVRLQKNLRIFCF